MRIPRSASMMNPTPTLTPSSSGSSSPKIPDSSEITSTTPRKRGRPPGSVTYRRTWPVRVPGSKSENQKKSIDNLKANQQSSVDWDAVPLGFVSDRQLAQRLGVYVGTVQKKRLEAGVLRREPASPEAVREAVLGAVWPRAKSSIAEIHERVQRNIGAISERQVRRHVKKLQTEGFLNEDNVLIKGETKWR